MTEFLYPRVTASIGPLAEHLSMDVNTLRKKFRGTNPWTPWQLEKLKALLVKSGLNPDDFHFVENATGTPNAKMSPEAVQQNQALTNYTYAYLQGLGWSRAKLAAATGYPEHLIRHILAGRDTAPFPGSPNENDVVILKAIATAMGVKIDEVPWMHPSQRQVAKGLAEAEIKYGTRGNQTPEQKAAADQAALGYAQRHGLFSMTVPPIV